MSAAGKVAARKTKASEPDPSVLIEGYGSLKGQLPLPHDIDWTKPIYEQASSSQPPASANSPSSPETPKSSNSRPATRAT